MKIYIGIPCYNSQIYTEVAQDLFEVLLEAKNKGDEISLHMPSSPFLTLSRNLIMQKGLDSDWILMWDSDIQVPTPKFLYQMIETAYKQDAVVVGLLVRTKHPQETKYASAIKNEAGDYINIIEAPHEPKEVDVVGCGVMLINCKWVRDNLEQPYFEFKDKKVATGPAILPEDWNFCDKVKAKGGKIVIEPRISTIHYGNYGYTYEAGN